MNSVYWCASLVLLGVNCKSSLTLDSQSIAWGHNAITLIRHQKERGWNAISFFAILKEWVIPAGWVVNGNVTRYLRRSLHDVLMTDGNEWITTVFKKRVNCWTHISHVTALHCNLYRPIISSGSEVFLMHASVRLHLTCVMVPRKESKKFAWPAKWLFYLRLTWWLMFCGTGHQKHSQISYLVFGMFDVFGLVVKLASSLGLIRDPDDTFVALTSEKNTSHKLPWICFV